MVITLINILSLRHLAPYYVCIKYPLYINYDLRKKVYFIDAYDKIKFTYYKLIEKEIINEMRFARTIEQLANRIVDIEW